MAELAHAIDATPGASRQPGAIAKGGLQHTMRARCRITSPVLVMACALVAFAPAHALASDIRFVGNTNYSTTQNAAALTADEVRNIEAGGISGTLRLEFWALPAPYGGQAFTGNKLAQYTLAPLPAGSSHFNVNSGLIPYAPPPDGTWYLVLLVTEYVAQPLNDGYVVRDSISFPGPIVFGPSPPALTPQVGTWWNPDESGSGYGLDYKHGVLVVSIYSYTATGTPQWYLASGPLSGTTFTSTLEKYTGGQCISCAYNGRPSSSGNDGTIRIVFSSPTSATAYLPNGRVTQIQPVEF